MRIELQHCNQMHGTQLSLDHGCACRALTQGIAQSKIDPAHLQQRIVKYKDASMLRLTSHSGSEQTREQDARMRHKIGQPYWRRQKQCHNTASGTGCTMTRSQNINILTQSQRARQSDIKFIQRELKTNDYNG